MFGGYSNRRGIQVFDLKSETWTEMVKKNHFHDTRKKNGMLRHSLVTLEGE